MTSTHKPRDIYNAAIQERKSDDPLKKRQACEKGWLAVVEAIDEFLAENKFFIPKGTPDAHIKRSAALDEIVIRDPSMWELRQKYFSIQGSLHGACFYGGQDSPLHDQDLKRTVREILELTGHCDAEIEDDSCK